MRKIPSHTIGLRLGLAPVAVSLPPSAIVLRSGFEIRWRMGSVVSVRGSVSVSVDQSESICRERRGRAELKAASESETTRSELAGWT